ncbi:CopL family metal-binding regulatory protein [Luteimonas vadosa]
MRPPAILLHLLLLVGLVLNGPGNAFAFVHAGMGATAGDSAQLETQPACHDGGSAQAPVRSMPAVHHSMFAGGDDLSARGGEHPRDLAGSDCCDAGSCRCACVHGAVAVVEMPARAPFAAIVGSAVRPLVSAHPAPVLPHLIRPPIG